MTDYPPDLFAATHQGTDGDVEFYRRQCEGAGSVLELGCGYGRLLRELVHVAGEVHGLDCDDALLGMAATTSAHLHHGDMADFDLGRVFDRILIPHSGVYCLSGEKARLACFGAARRHLPDDGALLMDAYVADEFHAESQTQSWPDDEEVELDSVQARGQMWRLFERSHWNREAQRIDVTYRYRGDDGTSLEGTLRHRYLLLPQLQSELGRAGFDAELYGGFADEPFTTDAQSWTVRATPRPGK